MIDDDEKLCRLVREYLSPFGFEVVAEHRGDTGLKAVTAQEFDAVILDVMLPGMDGFEVLKQIRAVSPVPVLMLTALGDEADRIVGPRSALTIICRRPSRRGNCSLGCVLRRGGLGSMLRLTRTNWPHLIFDSISRHGKHFRTGPGSS